MKRTENVEMQKRILLTAFRNTSADLLLKEMKGYKTLLLPNDKVKDSEKLIKEIINEPFDFVISLGQRPNIKNKVHIPVVKNIEDVDWFRQVVAEVLENLMK